MNILVAKRLELEYHLQNILIAQQNLFQSNIGYSLSKLKTESFNEIERLDSIGKSIKLVMYGLFELFITNTRKLRESLISSIPIERSYLIDFFDGFSYLIGEKISWYSGYKTYHILLNLIELMKNHISVIESLLSRGVTMELKQNNYIDILFSTIESMKAQSLLLLEQTENNTAQVNSQKELNDEINKRLLFNLESLSNLNCLFAENIKNIKDSYNLTGTLTKGYFYFLFVIFIFLDLRTENITYTANNCSSDDEEDDKIKSDHHGSHLLASLLINPTSNFIEDNYIKIEPHSTSLQCDIINESDIDEDDGRDISIYDTYNMVNELSNVLKRRKNLEIKEFN